MPTMYNERLGCVFPQLLRARCCVAALCAGLCFACASLHRATLWLLRDGAKLFATVCDFACVCASTRAVFTRALPPLCDS
jgi:hypothetical protein